MATKPLETPPLNNITTRDLMIAAALNGILSKGIKEYADGPFELDSASRIGAFAVRLADAALEARGKS